MLGFLVFYLWFFRARLRFPHAWLLLPFGAVASWLLNAVRIAALVWVGDRVSAEVAVGGFHSLAGWVAFLGLALGVMVAVPHCTFLARGDAEANGDARPEAQRATAAGCLTAAYLMPLLVLTATAMVTGAFSAGLDLAYPLRVVTVAITLWVYRRSYRDLWSPSWSLSAVAIGAAVCVLWLALEPLAAPSSQPQPVWEIVSRPFAVFWLGARVLESVLIVPFAEELAFRGYLLRRLSGQGSSPVSPGAAPWTAIVISSLLFGALHGRCVAGTVAGVAYALAQQRRGALRDAIVAHAVTNAGIALVVLTTGSWSFWT
jgi:exosortase E/protease (VPEID-CTERM system)